MKKILSGLLIIGLLTSCSAGSGAQDTTQSGATVQAKTAFDISYAKYSQFPKEYTIAKTGKLSSNAQVTVTSQGIGRIDQILVKEGTSVKKGQVIARLKDTTANYDLRLSQSSNAVATVRNTAKSTEITLDKVVRDTEIALNKAKSDLKTTEDSAAKSLEKAERDAQKSQVNGVDTDAAVTLSQLEASLNKAEQDYKNLTVSNKQTLLNFNTSYQTSLADFKKFVNKLVFEGDRLYGITPRFQAENIQARQYLGGNSQALKPKLEFAYYDLQKVAADIEATQPTEVTETTLISALDSMKRHYESVRAYLEVTTKYLENSSVGAQFPQTQLDGYIGVNNGYKSELSGLENAWVAFRNNASLFLANYKNNESSAEAAYFVQKKNFELQQKNLATGEFDTKINLDKLKISNEQLINNAKVGVETAQLAYDNARKNREVTLEKMRLAERDALLAETQAREELAKLTISSPIDGSITRVISTAGVDVSTGTPVVEIASPNSEVLFEVEANLVPLLKIGTDQTIQYMDKTLTGTVVGLSQVATDTLLYNARVSIPPTSALLGQIATVDLKIKSENPVVGLDNIRIISDKTGEVQVLDEAGLIVKKEVSIVRIIGSSAEIRSDMSPETKIIISSTVGYDPKKYEIQSKEVSPVSR